MTPVYRIIALMIMGLMDCSESDINGLMTWELLYAVYRDTALTHAEEEARPDHSRPGYSCYSLVLFRFRLARGSRAY